MSECSKPCETCSMEENCYSVHSCDRYLKWRFPERYEKEKEVKIEVETKEESITDKMSKRWYE